MNPKESSRAIHRLLFVRLSAMGDVLHAMPAVAALRLALPDTRMGWVVEERWADLVRCAAVHNGSVLKPIVDDVHTVNFQQWRHSLTSTGTRRQIRASISELRSYDYDGAIDFQGAARSALVARLSRAQTIYGFVDPRENVASMFYTTTILTQEKHVIAQNLALASAVARHVLHAPQIEFMSHDGSCRPSETCASGYIILNPGAGWGAKQWPAERYGEVAKGLATEFQVRALINAGPGEADLIRAAESASGGAAQRISCSPLELIDVVKGARLFIGGDTGPLHLAAAMGVPVVAIFGPTDPARTGPFGTRSILLRNPDSRTIRSHESSPDAGILSITTQDVVRAAIQLLRDTRA